MDSQNQPGTPRRVGFQQLGTSVPPAGRGSSVPVDDAGGRDSKAARPRKKKPAAAAGSAPVEGWKLYLTDDVRFRLRMLAFQRGKKISTVANEILDRNLPRWTLERTE